MFVLLDFKERCPKTFYFLCGMLAASFIIGSALLFSYGVQRFGWYLSRFISWPRWLYEFLSSGTERKFDVIWTVPPPKNTCADEEKDKNGNCPEKNKAGGEVR